MKKSLFAATGLMIAACVAPGAALAQMAEGSQSSPLPRNYVAAGAAMLPDYAGSDDYRVIPFGAARFELAGVSFRTQGPGLAASLYENGPWELGAYVRWSGAVTMWRTRLSIVCATWTPLSSPAAMRA